MKQTNRNDLSVTFVGDFEQLVEHVVTLVMYNAEKVHALQLKIASLLPTEEKTDYIVEKVPDRQTVNDAVRKQLWNKSHFFDSSGKYTRKAANLTKVVTDVGLDVILTTLTDGIGGERFLIHELPETIRYIDKLNNEPYKPGTYRKTAVRRFNKLPDV